MGPTGVSGERRSSGRGRLERGGRPTFLGAGQPIKYIGLCSRRATVRKHLQYAHGDRDRWKLVCAGPTSTEPGAARAPEARARTLQVLRGQIPSHRGRGMDGESAEAAVSYSSRGGAQSLHASATKSVTAAWGKVAKLPSLILGSPVGLRVSLVYSARHMPLASLRCWLGWRR